MRANVCCVCIVWISVICLLTWVFTLSWLAVEDTDIVILWYCLFVFNFYCWRCWSTSRIRKNTFTITMLSTACSSLWHLDMTTRHWRSIWQCVPDEMNQTIVPCWEIWSSEDVLVCFILLRDSYLDIVLWVSQRHWLFSLEMLNEVQKFDLYYIFVLNFTVITCNFLWTTVCSILNHVNLSSFIYGAIQINRCDNDCCYHDICVPALQPVDKLIETWKRLCDENGFVNSLEPVAFWCLQYQSPGSMCIMFLVALSTSHILSIK